MACHGLPFTATAGVRPIFRRLFREYGLPERIRSDNGVPFASIALGRLSQLSVWWVRLGILPNLIEPSSPQQNGRHERMHKTLKAEVTRPPEAGARARGRSSAASMRSGASTTRSGRPSHWTRGRQRPGIPRRCGPIRSVCLRSSTRHTVKSVG